MSASDLARAAQGVKPQVFLCPGVYGDDPRLARFRRFCEPVLDLVLLDLPPLRAPARLLRSIPGTGAAIARTVQRLQPTGVVRLVGYSFGGNVALEVAQDLVRQSRSVSLVLIDAYRAERGAPQRRSLARRAFWITLDTLCGWDWARKLLLHAAGRGSPDRRAAFERRMLWSLRRQATAAWRPRPVGASILLVASEPFADEIVRWRTVIPHAAVVRLPCDHWDILRHPAALRLRDLLVAHLAPTSGR